MAGSPYISQDVFSPTRTIHKYHGMTSDHIDCSVLAAFTSSPTLFHAPNRPALSSKTWYIKFVTYYLKPDDKEISSTTLDKTYLSLQISVEASENKWVFSYLFAVIRSNSIKARTVSPSLKAILQLYSGAICRTSTPSAGTWKKSTCAIQISPGCTIQISVCFQPLKIQNNSSVSIYVTYLKT